MLEKDEQRCYIVLCIFILLVLTAAYYAPFWVSFVAFLALNWYISIPIFVVGFFLYKFFSNKRRLNHLAITFNNLDTQADFERRTGQKAIIGSKFSKEYKAWLIKDVPKKEPKISPISHKTTLMIIGIILAFAFFSYILIRIYNLIFQFFPFY
jgi:hypothetical protein